MSIPFKPTNILLPKSNFEKWAVIACDQFTSDKKYWQETESIVGENISTLKITLPEIYLEEDGVSTRIDSINHEMKRYLDSSVFDLYEDAIIYIERIQPDGRLRQGIIGAVDLEAYDYSRCANTPIRATEGTVLERIPPRVQIRKNAPLELPHIMLLINDVNKKVIEPLKDKKDCMTKLYDFDLIMGGGHITGYLLNKDQQEDVINGLTELYKSEDNPLLFAVGDGNHSLATAKECYEQLKKQNIDNILEHPARYALAEVGNIHSDALDFEPIYRVLFNVNPTDVLEKMNVFFNRKSANSVIKYVYGDVEGSVEINIPSDKISTGIIQEFIDDYILSNPECKVDYIHGIDDVKKLSKEKNTIGFIYDGITKDTLFETVKTTGALPRKTFSMGEARDKRYYLECRKIK